MTTMPLASNRDRQTWKHAGRPALIALLVSLTTILAACGEFGGAESGTAAAPQQLTGGAGGAASEAAFQSSVYQLTTANCGGSGCHATTRSPLHAHPPISTAHSAVLTKVDLANPGASRMVTKLMSGNAGNPTFHHCWTSLDVAGCTADQAAMTAAIQQWADDINFGPGGVAVSDTLSSSSITLADGVQDVGSERVTDNMIAFWEFKEGSGPVAADTSGIDPPIDLALQGNDITWLSSYGVNIVEGRLFGDPSTARKLYDHIADPSSGTNQYTVELWISNATVDLTGPARIMTYSSNQNRRNMMLGQVQYQYFFRNRSTDPEISLNGTEALATYDQDEDLQDRLQHVVLTYDQYRGRRIYVDALFTDDIDESGGDPLWNWDPAYPLVFGDENTFGRQWEGQVRMAAVYNAALTEAQIQQNFIAGVGKRLKMRFDVAQWAGAGTAVEFVVSDFDNGSYLFCTPTFRMTGATPVRVANMRIAVNGVIATTGQAFTTVDTLAAADGQELSAQCSIIAKPVPPNPTGDEFAIVFEYLGGFENVVVPLNPPVGGVVLSSGAVPANGLRDFARINESMAEVTGVDPLLTEVRDVYLGLVQQLPPGPDLRTFVSSHEVGIAKLALEYCDALVEDVPLRRAMWLTTLDDPVNGFDFGLDPLNAFGTRLAPDVARRNLIYDGLYDNMLVHGANESLTLQPDRVDVRAHLDTMVDDLLVLCETNVCNAERTETTVKGACAAVLSSAAMNLH
jgi:hypothetical protein